MKYFLAGIDVAKGTIDDDVSDTRPYYELGWEVTTTHFDAKRFKKSGEIDYERDTIVTCGGREFLYTSEFARVIEYSRFIAERGPGDIVVSLMERYAGGHIPRDYYAEGRYGADAVYKYLREDSSLLTSFGLSGIRLPAGDEPYCCMCVRKRAHGNYRNFDNALARDVIGKLREKYSRIFVVGRNVEPLLSPPEVAGIDLATFAAIIQSNRCQMIIGSLTGPMHIAALVSKAPVSLVLNHDGYDVDVVNHPVLMGRCIRLSPTRFHFVHPNQMRSIISRSTL
jgi:hypothetical protein